MPNCGPGWVVVKTRVVQPSVTEAQLFYGERSSRYEQVGAKLETGPQPLFGHEFCAEIVEIEKSDQGAIAIGDRVAARHTELGVIGRDFPGCFSEYAALPVPALAKVPDELSDWEAAALQPLTSCVRNIEALGIAPGDTVLVLGLGAMGMNSAQAARAAGADMVIGTAKRPEVLEMAERLGINATINATRQNVVETVMELTKGQGASVVIEAASGSPKMGLSGGATLAEAVACVAQGGKILSVSHFHERVTLDLNDLRAKRVTLMFPPGRADPDVMGRTTRLVANKVINIEAMLTHRLIGIEKLPEALEITAHKSKHGALNPAQVRFA